MVAVIALLRGTVAASALGEVVLDVGGVGYRVFVPPGMSLTRSAGAEVTLHTHLVVREDALTLYGFAQPSARQLFTTLLGVTGVGPKLALAALGTLGADGLRRAVVSEDVAALTVVPGVGRKSAQRIVLELREKLGGLTGGDLVPKGGVGMPPTPREEVRQALLALGYAPAEAAAALDTVLAGGASAVEPASSPGNGSAIAAGNGKSDGSAKGDGDAGMRDGETAEQLLRAALRALGAR